ncbi:M16 family metallopeptidase [Mesoterricola sediminis]|uniref:Peptidase M16 n=1 Tax=Mesoterricola sediminis TaxID=2927980 RepID=A0AA48HH87_9BACT|nr:pitrilysin family protein [Mesoterricola sediminis]BDU78183.1 peptidase M16 [Mesoterricola sediminis]
MIRPILLSLAAGLALQAQAIPPRPEAIAFKPLAFSVPKAGAFKADLSNGIPVYIAEEPDGLPFVRIRVFIKGGAYLDPAGKEGLAALAGAQLRAGGTLRTPAAALDERLEFLAASIQSSLGDTSGSVSLDILEKDLTEGLDLFMQVLTQPAFAPERLDQAKRAIRQNLASRGDKLESIAAVELPRLLYRAGHFTSAQPTAASVAALTREDLAAFHARLLHPANLVVSVSGKFQRKAMLARLDATLGRLKAGPAAKPSPVVPAPGALAKPGIYVVDKAVPQSLVQWALPGLRRTDPDWAAATVLNSILASGDFTCRLMKKIRSDEGLTYGIGGAFGEGSYWRGHWSGSFQTKNKSVAYALRLFLGELDRIKREPVPAEELGSIQNTIVEAFPARWGRKANVVNLFAGERLVGWPEDGWTDYRERIRAVTAADVQRVARTYLDPAKLVLLVVGKADEALAGDPEHPGPLAAVAPLPVVRLPLRDPLTLKPLS